MSGSLQAARLVADAVRDEGYLLYPYRATSGKNQVRWQFGVLGPPGAATAGVGEETGLSSECLLRNASGDKGASITVYLRFLQLQVRSVERADAQGFSPVDELRVGGKTWLSWDEAVDREIALGPFSVADLSVEGGLVLPVDVPGGSDVEPVHEGSAVMGRVIRTRYPLQAVVRVGATVPRERPAQADLLRLHLSVENVGGAPASEMTAQQAIQRSFIGAHLLAAADGCGFVSLADPPPDAVAAAAGCQQHRCWPVLAGAARSDGTDDVVLVSPIILEDHPKLAEQSAGALFDSTEIDEILTLRVMTMTDEEKAQARATDPRAAEIIDRCSEMSPDSLMRLHGILRNPHALDQEPSSLVTDSDVPWWDPGADASVRPEVDSVLVGDVPVSAGSRVRLRPSRRADAQDLFYAGRTARVTAVLSDVDGGSHVAVVVDDDPAAELHDWYGRYLYFAPDELEPLPAEAPDQREEGRP